MTASTLRSTSDSHLFDIICNRAGIAPSDLSAEDKYALLHDEQTQYLWAQLQARIQGHAHNNDSSERRPGPNSQQQLAEFARVAAVQSIHDQASLTPDRIAQAEAELENLNRKTQSLVDTLRSHNTRLAAIGDAGFGNSSSSSDGARSALSAKAGELTARKQALDEECEQLAAHADQRLDRYLGGASQDKQRSNGVESSNGRPSGASEALRETFDGLLGPHDRILEKLDALCTELQFDDSDQKAMLADARRLSNEIIFAIVAHQRMVLDIVFIQACKSYQRSPLGHAAKHAVRAADDEREAIVTDLRSLWDEVVPVAHMAVEKQLVGPIMKSRGRESDMRDERYALIASYTSAMLRYMNEHLAEFAGRIRTLVAQHRALVKTFQIFKDRTASGNKIENTNLTSNTPATETKVSQAAADRRKPGRLAAGAAAAKSTTTTTSTPLDDLLSAIEALGVSLPPGAYSSDQQVDTAGLARHLDRQIQRRAAKSAVLAADMQALFEATAKAGVSDPLEAAGMLADSLVAECSGGLRPVAESNGDEAPAFNSSSDGGGLFFADTELEKIIGDEARSVARIADDFRRLLREVNPGGNSDAGLEPGDFVTNAYRSSTAAGGTSAQGGHGGMPSRGQQQPQQRHQLRDPKIHEIIEKWGAGGGGGGVGVGG
ncbi:hypothetical protein Micbo1qcDRAFT_197199 [Microdochium bolleyi]|uniref:Uncharacterized protein n=1 Tax=Microdochium bolleyi TaxID=196109 RepID=A0A136IV46_9PEZI|nr:hypothetical protein Micbo1qcDRAFT_197199 [Microdochium bolleyi]